MSTSLKNEFWDCMEDIRSGMLTTHKGRAIPMSHYVDQDAKVLWFITADDTELAKAAQSGAAAEYLVMSKDENLYARIEGSVQAVTDPAKVDELWSIFAAAWFEDGRKDDDIQLIRMDLKEAEVWMTGGSLAFLYEIAKANLTHETPDAGEHGTITF